MMSQKNRFATNSNINNPLPDSEFYISENDRLFGDNFATGEYLRRKQEIEKKKEKYKLRQNQTFERERKRWERLDYDYLKKENQSMMNKERNLVGRKNNPGMAFNPLNLQYDNSVQGEILKRRDEEAKYRSWLRSINIDKHSNTGYNIINGEERKILEERLNKDIVPDLIQKNIDQINEMKNKVIFNYNNFYTRCNPSSPDLRGYRYDNNNNNFNGNRINRSTNTPNIINNNGGRFRAPVDPRDERMLYDNNVARSNNFIRQNNNFDNNNDFNNMRNNFSPQPRSPRQMPYEGNDMNNMNMNMNNNNMNMNMGNNNRDNMNNINNMDYNNMNNNMNNNNMNYNNNDMMMNNNNNQYNANNKMPTPNVGIIDLNNMDSNNMNPNINQNDNNNTLNNNYRNMNNMNNQNNRANQTPNNFVQNGNNIMGNNANSNLEQNDLNNYQPPPQSNYGVNPYNPYSRPACVY